MTGNEICWLFNGLCKLALVRLGNGSHWKFNKLAHLRALVAIPFPLPKLVGNGAAMTRQWKLLKERFQLIYPMDRALNGSRPW
jgi:hypothetical protein